MATPKKDWRRTFVNIGTIDLVPKEFYAIDILLMKKPFKMAEKDIYNLRYGSYKNVKAKYGTRAVSEMYKYWNNNVAEFDESVNLFLTVPGLEAIAHRIFMFEQKSDNPKNRQITQKLSFGILREEYDNFVKTGEVVKKLTALANDEDSTLPWVAIACGRTIEFNERVKCRNVPEVQLWKTWCKANGLKQSDAIIAAMKLQMEKNPGKAKLPPIEEFMNGKTVDDYEYTIPRKYIGDDRKTGLRLNADREVFEETKTMLVRYNRYAELVGIPRYTMQDYVTKALLMFNNAVLKKLLPYSKEYKELEKDVSFVERHIINK